MNREEFLDAQYRISFTAGMNQRYHQRLASYLAWSDRAVRILVAALAVASLLLCFTTDTAWSIGVSLAGVVAAMVLNIVPLGEWQRDHVDLFRRWSDLREEIDVIAVGMRDSATAPLVERLRCLEAKMHRICGGEPHFIARILRRCEHEERASRGEKMAA